MNETSIKTARVGATLVVIAALLAGIARAAAGQGPGETPRRLSLGDAARLAAQRTAAVESARLRVEGARARVNQQRADRRPQVNIVPNWTTTTINSASFGFNFPADSGQEPLLDPNGQIIGPVRMWDFRGQIDQTVYDPALNQRIRAARAGVGSASADVATVADASATTAAVMYVRAARTEAVVRARVADSVLAAGLLGIARDQLAAGVGIALDVTRSESQFANARAQLIGARNDRARSQLDLRRALNLPLDDVVELSDSLASLPFAEPTTVPAAIEAAMQHRPDLRALSAQLNESRQHVAAIRATRLPRVGVFGNDGANGFINHLLNTYVYGIQMSWSVFDGGRRSAEAGEQDARSRDIEVKQRDLRQQIALDVRSALLDLVSAREQVDAARERAQFAEQEVAQAQERFRAGVASNADVITASATLNAARTGLIDALTAYQSARVELAHAQGTVAQLR